MNRIKPTATRTATSNKKAASEKRRRPSLLFYISFNLNSLYGGEGGIRTPDSLSTMPDFESGAFNRALPPLRVLALF